jgi:hypothetical protein
MSVLSLLSQPSMPHSVGRRHPQAERQQMTYLLFDPSFLYAFREVLSRKSYSAQAIFLQTVGAVYETESVSW